MVKIIGVDAFPLALADPQTGPRGYATQPPWPSIYGNHRETLVVRLTADDGTTGWGEALAPVAPEVPGEIVRRLLTPALLGADPRQVRPLRHQLAQLMRERGHLGGHQADAIAAVDIALWDLAGKLAGLPVVELLGGAFRTQVPTYVSGLRGRDDAERVGYARDLIGQDVRQVKIGLGYGVDADLATVEALRQLDAGLRVAVDVHGVYDLADAVRLGRGMAERGGWFLEAPLAFEDVAGHADLASRLDLPVALGESLRHRWEFQPYVAARAAGILQPDIGRTGITEGLAIAQFAETYHLPVAPHHSAGLGIALAAGLHVAAACANLTAFEWHPSLFDKVNDILAVPIDCTPTSIALPAGPGLGISVDEDAVARYCTWTTS